MLWVVLKRIRNWKLLISISTKKQLIKFIFLIYRGKVLVIERKRNMREQQVKLLCIDLSHHSSALQFVFLSLTVFGFHLVQGYFHELIFKLKEFKPFSMYLTLLQFGIYALLAALESLFKSNFDPKQAFRRKYEIGLI